MQVKEIMTRDVIHISPHTKVVEVAEIMFKNGFHGLPVVEGEKVIGIITENDFFIKDQGMVFLPSYINFLKEKRIFDELPGEKKRKVKKLLSLEAKDIMTANPVTVTPDMEVSELLEFIKKTRFNTLPVTDEEKHIFGIVTLVDVIGVAKQTRDSSNLHEPRKIEELVKDMSSGSDMTAPSRRPEPNIWKFILAITLIAIIIGLTAFITTTISR